MTKLAVYSTIALLALAPTLAYARDDGRSRLESFADQQHCDALTQQWNQASAGAKVTDNAKKAASEGEVLCRAGKYEEGSKTLAGALKQIGIEPK